MSENIKEAITKAIGSHGMWKARLRDAIESQTSEFEVDFVRSCHNCEFGKWLDDDKSELAQDKFYDTIYNMHKDVHMKTANVMSLALEGKSAEAQESMDGQFTESSTALISEMMKWSKSL